MPDFSAPFNALIAQNTAPPPNPLMQIGQFAQTQTALSNSQTAAAQANDAQLQNAQNHFAMIASAMTPLLAKGANITAGDVASAGANLVADTKGYISADEIAHYIKNELPPDGPGIQQALQGQLLRLQSASERIATLRGQNADFQGPDGMHYGIRNSFSGVRTPQGGPYGFAPAGTSAGERIAPASVTDANGNTTQTTVGQRAAAAGVDPLSGLPFQNAISRPGQGGVGGIPAPAPSFSAGLDALNKDRLAASDTMQGLQPLLKALPLAQALGTTGSGPGTKSFNDAKALLISQGVIKPDANVDMRNELDKYLAQAVAKSPLSGRSDMGTIVAQSSNPNTVTQTNPATVGLIKNAIVQSRMAAAAPLAFNDNPANYPTHKGSFIQNQDQRAYGLDLEPDGGRSTVQKMAALPVGNAARTRFFESLKAAKTVGVGAGR